MASTESNACGAEVGPGSARSVFLAAFTDLADAWKERQEARGEPVYRHERLAAQAEMHAEMQRIADGVKARHARPAEPAAAPVHVPTREQLLADLRAAVAGFDPNYEACDHYSEWSRQNAKAQRIAELRAALDGRGPR